MTHHETPLLKCARVHDHPGVSAGGMTQRPGDASNSFSEGEHKKIKPFLKFLKIKFL